MDVVSGAKSGHHSSLVVTRRGPTVSRHAKEHLGGVSNDGLSFAGVLETVRGRAQGLPTGQQREQHDSLGKSRCAAYLILSKAVFELVNFGLFHNYLRRLSPLDEGVWKLTAGKDAVSRTAKGPSAQ